jgi:superfamily II RNA helicase
MDFLIIDDCKTMPALPADMSMDISYTLDPFQAHAVNAIHSNENVLVTAKTGSGKTLLAEYQIAHSLRHGRRVFYTTPIKSLSNQKFHDLKKMFPSVGIMTGDIKFRPDADVVIMTTEILRNLLYKQSTTTQELGITAALSLDRLDAVVFDEVHYINDRDRGRVWEETMILLAPEVKMVLLSATIDSPELFAGWLGDLKKRPIHLLSTQHRVVPLLHGILDGDRVIPILTEAEKFQAKAYNDWLKGLDDVAAKEKRQRAEVAGRRVGGYEDPVIKRDARSKSYTHQLNQTIRTLETRGDLPALCFVLSRTDCSKYAGLVEGTLLTTSDAAAVEHILDFHLHRHLEILQPLEQYHSLRRLLIRGIAYHHSGIIPLLKEITEVLFGRGYIKVLFATETFAVGINMPTKTVIFNSYRKFDSDVGGMRMLRTDEYIQMAGRAGRRGKDTQGLVLYLPAREPECVLDVQNMMCGRRAAISSKMAFGLEFLLKVLHNPGLDFDLVFENSYWRRQQLRLREGLRLELEALQTRKTGLQFTEREFADMGVLLAIQAELKTTTNKEKREVQQRLEKWRNTHMGPRWKAVEMQWPMYQKLESEGQTLEGQIAYIEKESGRILEQIDLLKAGGFVEEDGRTLTRLGRMATEVNEGHPILMPLLFESGLCSDLTAAEIMAVLSIFVSESEKEESVTLEELSIPASLMTTLGAVTAFMGEKDSDYKVQFGAVEGIWHWLQGAEFGQVCTECGIYEGNFLRVVMKMGNILEEWRTMATLCGDVDMLNKMTDVQITLLRGFAVCESLYLRI